MRCPHDDVLGVRPSGEGPDSGGLLGGQADGLGRPRAAQPAHHLRACEKNIYIFWFAWFSCDRHEHVRSYCFMFPLGFFFFFIEMFRCGKLLFLLASLGFALLLLLLLLYGNALWE